MWFLNFWPIFTSLLYALNIAIAVYSSIKLISSKRDPVKTLSWVLVMMLLPYIGILLYFFFGRNFRKDKMFSRKGARDLGLRKELCKEMLVRFEDRNNIPQEVRRCHKIIVQNLRSAYSLLSANDKVDIFFSGKEALSAMLDEGAAGCRGGDSQFLAVSPAFPASDSQLPQSQEDSGGGR